MKRHLLAHLFSASRRLYPELSHGQWRVTRYWIGVAPKDHVLTGVEGGFCQLCHGRCAPLQRLYPGDWIVYYSPRASMGDGGPVQAFTAAGRVIDRSPYLVDMGEGFTPYRGDVEFEACATEAPIRPLLDRLSFSRGQLKSWGQVLRRGVFEINAEDFGLISNAMRFVIRSA